MFTLENPDVTSGRLSGRRTSYLSRRRAQRNVFLIKYVTGVGFRLPLTDVDADLVLTWDQDHRNRNADLDGGEKCV